MNIGGETLEVRWFSRHSRVVVDDDRLYHYALTTEQWEGCDTLGGVRICANVRLRREGFGGTCIGALFRSRASSDPKESPLRHCEATTRKNPAVYVAEISPGMLRVTSGDKKVVWRMTCASGNAENVTTTVGTQTISVPAGCSISGLDVSYKMLPASMRTAARHAHLATWSTELPGAWSSGFGTWTNVTQFLRDAQDWKTVAEVEAEARDRELALVNVDRHVRDYAAVGTLAGIGVVLLVVLICLVLGWRRVRRIRREQKHSPVQVLEYKKRETDGGGLVEKVNIEEEYSTSGSEVGDDGLDCERTSERVQGGRRRRRRRRKAGPDTSAKNDASASFDTKQSTRTLCPGVVE